LRTAVTSTRLRTPLWLCRVSTLRSTAMTVNRPAALIRMTSSPTRMSGSMWRSMVAGAVAVRKGRGGGLGVVAPGGVC
jgi:hypothetical protein